MSSLLLKIKMIIYCALMICTKHWAITLFFFNFMFLLYNTVLVLRYIDMNPPQVYMSSQSWTPLPPLYYSLPSYRWGKAMWKKLNNLFNVLQLSCSNFKPNSVGCQSLFHYMIKSHHTILTLSIRNQQSYNRRNQAVSSSK